MTLQVGFFVDAQVGAESEKRGGGLIPETGAIPPAPE
jgi:hypothetical protein